MSEESSMFSSENLQTIVAVAFILAILSLVLNFYNFRRVNVATAGLSGFDVAEMERAKTADDALTARIDALEAELKTVKSDLAAQKAAATQQAAATPAEEPEAATP